MPNSSNHPAFKAELGRRIEHLASRFPTKGEAARVAGVTLVQFNKWIAGTVKVPIEALYALSEEAGVNFSWLATGNGPVTSTDDPGSSEGHATGAQDLKSEMSVSVPVFDVRASAGNGVMNFGEVVADHVSLPVSYLKDQLRVNPKDACGIYVNGDSMEPALDDGGIALLDRSQEARSNKADGIYTFRIGDELFIKRLERQGSRIVVHSDNRAYTPWEMTDEDKASMKILARVVGAFRNL